MPSRDEQLQAIQNSVVNSTGGASPDDYKNINGRVMPPANINDLNVVPAKPDPEAEAQRIIQEHIAQMGQMVRPQDVKPVNPETGMPYYSAAPQVSPEDDQRKQMMQFKMDYLKRQAGGQ
jgi:hypothetical protein